MLQQKVNPDSLTKVNPGDIKECAPLTLICLSDSSHHLKHNKDKVCHMREGTEKIMAWTRLVNPWFLNLKTGFS